MLLQKRYRSNRVLLYNNDKASIIKDMNIVEIEQSHSRGKIVSQTFDWTPMNILNLHFLDWAPKNLSLATGHPAGAIHCHSVPYVAIQLPIKSLRDARTATIISSPAAPIVILLFYFHLKKSKSNQTRTLTLSSPAAPICPLCTSSGWGAHTPHPPTVPQVEDIFVKFQIDRKHFCWLILINLGYFGWVLLKIGNISCTLHNFTLI